MEPLVAKLRLAHVFLITDNLIDVYLRRLSNVIIIPTRESHKF